MKNHLLHRVAAGLALSATLVSLACATSMSSPLPRDHAAADSFPNIGAKLRRASCEFSAYTEFPGIYPSVQVKNTGAPTLAAGTAVHWRSVTGVTGTVVLQQALAPGATAGLKLDGEYPFPSKVCTATL